MSDFKELRDDLEVAYFEIEEQTNDRDDHIEGIALRLAQLGYFKMPFIPSDPEYLSRLPDDTRLLDRYNTVLRKWDDRIYEGWSYYTYQEVLRNGPFRLLPDEVFGGI